MGRRHVGDVAPISTRCRRWKANQIAEKNRDRTTVPLRRLAAALYPRRDVSKAEFFG